MGYGYKFKKRCVKMWREGKEIPRSWHTCTRHTFMKQVRRWARVWESLGPSALRPRKTRRSWTAGEKLAIVSEVEKGGRTLNRVAASHGMENSDLLAWILAYREKGIDGLKCRRKGRKEAMMKDDVHAQGQSPGKKLTRRELERENLRLRARSAFLECAEELGISGEGKRPRATLAKAIAMAMDKERASGSRIYLGDFLEAAKMRRSTFHWAKARIDSDGDEAKNGELMEAIRAKFERHRGRYGSRRITAELRNEGRGVNHKRVERLMRKMGLRAEVRKKRYRSYLGNVGTICGNVLNRDFSAERPYQKLTTDVSQFNYGEGLRLKAYLSPAVDMFSGEVLGYTLSESPNLEMVSGMLDKAFRGRPVSGAVFHSDQGWQYQHKYYVERLKKKGIVQSMSRKGNCLDNCIMESFFGVLKNEMFYGHEQEFRSFGELKKAISRYIYYYNNVRIRKKTGWMSPVAFRKKWEAENDGL